MIFGFDQAVNRPAYKYLRQAGIKAFISYWGAPMSSLNYGWKLIAKRIQTLFSVHKPDHFIFQSVGMRKTATHGCGIPTSNTSIVRTGIDTDLFSPSEELQNYAHDAFGIPRNQRIFFFSGHMEKRKGVSVIIDTAKYLVNELHRNDIHFLILGNKGTEADTFGPMYKDTKASQHITFGGYRNDIPNILKSCYAGFIASIGWDSFPMSSIEMASTELPIIASDLAGLKEAVTSETGFLYPPGDFCKAAEKIVFLLDNPDIRHQMGKKARSRAIQDFSRDSQIRGIETVIRKVMIGKRLLPAPKK